MKRKCMDDGVLEQLLRSKCLWNICFEYCNDSLEEQFRVACTKNQMENVHLALRLGVQLNASIFQTACTFSNLDMVKFLLSTNVTYTHQEVAECVKKAVANKNQTVANYLFEYFKETPFELKTFRKQLYFACDFGELDVVKLLLSNCKISDGENESPQYSSKQCSFLCQAFRSACTSGHYAIVELMMHHSVFDKIIPASHDYTFQMTCAHLHLDIAKLLQKVIPISTKVCRCLIWFLEKDIPVSDNEKFTQMIAWLASFGE